jgi:hypothetical protein
MNHGAAVARKTYLIVGQSAIADRAVPFTACSWNASRRPSFLLHWSRCESGHVSDEFYLQNEFLMMATYEGEMR